MEFLRNFRPQTWVFDCASTAEFVDELYERWNRQNPGPPDSEKHGTIFLSYASEDEDIAKPIVNALAEAGLSVWFDHEELKGGDLWEKKIQQAIEKSFLFVPLLSLATLTSEGRFFRAEWEFATKWVSRLPSNSKFIVPVLLDKTSPRNPAFPERFHAAQCLELQRGPITGDFVKAFQRLYIDFQKSFR